jgi:hypothetical protein
MTRPTPRSAGIPSEADTGRNTGRAKQQLDDAVSILTGKSDLPHKAAQAAEAVQNKAQQGIARAETVADQALAKVPPPVRSRIEHVVATIQRRPGPSIAVAITVFMVLRKMRRRR